MTVAPRRETSRAKTSPMPIEAPVTKTVLPAKSNAFMGRKMSRVRLLGNGHRR